MTGINTLSSKLPDAPATLIVVSLPSTCATTIVMASLCVGFTLPGIILEPGSFSGIEISPKPQRGPLANQRISLAILFKLTASVFKAPEANTAASRAAKASNLFAAVTNGKPVNCANCVAA